MPPASPIARLRTRGAQLVGGPLAPLLRRSAYTLPLVALAGLAAGIFEGIGITFIIPLLGMLTPGGIPAELPGPLAEVGKVLASQDRETRLLVFGAAMIGFILLKGIVQGLNESYIFHLYSRLANDVRQALCTKLLALDYDFHLRHERARLLHIVLNESWNAAQSFRQALKIVPALAMLAVFAVILFQISAPLALVAVAGAAAIQGCLMALEWRQRKLSPAISNAQKSMGERIFALIGGMRAIRVFGQQERELDRFAATSVAVRKKMDRVYTVSAAAGPLIEVLVLLVFVAIMMTAVALQTPLPTVIAFLVLLSRCQPLAQVVSRARVDIAALTPAVDEVSWVLAQEPAARPAAATHEVRAIDAPIRFEGVSFEYPDGFAALHDATFTITPGAATALIGPSGSGKSTLVSLLCRLIEPTTGRIRLGEQDVGNFAADDWLSHVGIAGQDIDLLDGTIADNIAYGKPDATWDEIRLAAKTAGALGFIENTAKGFQTRVELGAQSFSGGQRQRIGLARALVRRPDLLILDEATSAVDAMSESEIIALLKEHRHFRSALIISHRKSTLAACEFGVVLDGGRVVEAGPLGSLDYFRTTMA
ncbi:ABC transporter ATP-binding protein [Tsuneonella sp. HG222]